MGTLIELGNPAARFLTQGALNNFWQGLLLAALAWAALRSLPRTSAATRYAVWTATLLAIVLLPLAPALMALRPAVNATPAAAVPGSPALVPVPLPENWTLALAAAWAVVAMLMLARVAWSYRAVRKLRCNLTLLAGRRLGKIAVATSPETGVPMTIGLRRPVIVVPEALPRQLTPAELDKVLLHELAHIRRQDHWTNLFQRVAEALFFFAPAVHWIGRKMQLEREIACDDWVVSVTGEARPYAACLTKLLELRLRRTSPQAALGALTGGRQISRRIELLVRRTGAGAAFSRSALLAASGGLAIALAALVQLPPVVGVAAPLAKPEAAIRPATWTPPVPVLPAVQARARAAAEPVRSAKRKAVVARVRAPGQEATAPAAAESGTGILLRPVSIFMDVSVESSSGSVTIRRATWVLIVIEGPPPVRRSGLKQT